MRKQTHHFWWETTYQQNNMTWTQKSHGGLDGKKERFSPDASFLLGGFFLVQKQIHLQGCILGGNCWEGGMDRVPPAKVSSVFCYYPRRKRCHNVRFKKSIVYICKNAYSENVSLWSKKSRNLETRTKNKISLRLLTTHYHKYSPCMVYLPTFSWFLW